MAYVWQLEPTEKQNNEQFFNEVYSFLEMMRRASPEQIEPHFKSYQPELETIDLPRLNGENVIFKRVIADQAAIDGKPTIDTLGVIALEKNQRQAKRVFTL